MLLQVVIQRHTREQFHGHVDGITLAIEVVYTHDIFVGNTTGLGRLALECLQSIFMAGKILV